MKTRMPIESAIKRAKAFYSSELGSEWLKMDKHSDNYKPKKVKVPHEFEKLPISVFFSLMRSCPELTYIKRSDLQEYKRLHNFSHKKLAQLLGVKPQQVMRWLSPSKNPNDFIPVHFADLLKVMLKTITDEGIYIEKPLSCHSYVDENGKRRMVIEKQTEANSNA